MCTVQGSFRTVCPCLLQVCNRKRRILGDCTHDHQGLVAENRTPGNTSVLSHTIDVLLDLTPNPRFRRLFSALRRPKTRKCDSEFRENPAAASPRGQECANRLRWRSRRTTIRVIRNCCFDPYTQNDKNKKVELTGIASDGAIHGKSTKSLPTVRTIEG